MEITGYLESDAAASSGGCNEKLVSETRTKELFQMLSDTSAGWEPGTAGWMSHSADSSVRYQKNTSCQQSSKSPTEFGLTRVYLNWPTFIPTQ